MFSKEHFNNMPCPLPKPYKAVWNWFIGVFSTLEYGEELDNTSIQKMFSNSKQFKFKNKTNHFLKEPFNQCRQCLSLCSMKGNKLFMPIHILPKGCICLLPKGKQVNLSICNSIKLLGYYSQSLSLLFKNTILRISSYVLTILKTSVP